MDRRSATTCAAKTRLTTLLGSSETGPIPTEVTDAEDWEYTEFSDLLPHRLNPVLDNLHELVIVRKASEEGKHLSTGKALRNSQPVFCAFPNLNEYRTKDLYS